MEKQTSDNIIFFYPSKLVGGAEYLFARLATYLNNFCNKKIYYIDYKDGFIRNNPEFKNLNFMDYSDATKTILNIDGTLITPISNIYKINDYLIFNNPNIYLFFWVLHTYNLIHVMPECNILENFSASTNRFILKHLCKNTYNIFNILLNECNKLNSIYFMDYTTYIYNKKIFDNGLDLKLLPIAANEKNIYSSGNIINENEINIAVLGRLCKEKVTSLINVAYYLNKLKTNKKKKLHIIGEGQCLNLIKPEKFKDIEIIFNNTLIGKELDNYLIKNVDILFSMGTCCLEGAALKLPVIVIPYSYNSFKQNKFHFLFNSNNYCLGTSLHDYKQNALLTMEDIINIIYINNKKAEFGQLCYDYYVKNHSFASIANFLLEDINKNKLSVKAYVKIKENTGNLRKNKNFIFKMIKGIVNFVK